MKSCNYKSTFYRLNMDSVVCNDKIMGKCLDFLFSDLAIAAIMEFYQMGLFSRSLLFHL